MPGGQDTIQPNDTVIIITTQQYLDDIDKIINFDFFVNGDIKYEYTNDKSMSLDIS